MHNGMRSALRATAGVALLAIAPVTWPDRVAALSNQAAPPEAARRPAKGSAVGLAQTPLIGILDRFAAADVPRKGPAEIEVAPRQWDKPVPPGLPGNGIAQHSMLYIGEGYNRMFLVHGGRIVWTYDTGPGNEYDDVWMLSNGNVLFTRMQ